MKAESTGAMSTDGSSPVQRTTDQTQKFSSTLVIFPIDFLSVENKSYWNQPLQYMRRYRITWRHRYWLGIEKHVLDWFDAWYCRSGQFGFKNPTCSFRHQGTKSSIKSVIFKQTFVIEVNQSSRHRCSSLSWFTVLEWLGSGKSENWTRQYRWNRSSWLHYHRAPIAKFANYWFRKRRHLLGRCRPSQDWYE